MAVQSGDEEGVQADPALGPLRLGFRLSHVLLADLLGALGDLDRRLVAVDIDVGPAQPGQFAGPEPAHEPGQPHGRVAVLGDRLEQIRRAWSIVSALRSLAGRASGSSTSWAGLAFTRCWRPRSGTPG